MNCVWIVGLGQNPDYGLESRQGTDTMAKNGAGTSGRFTSARGHGLPPFRTAGMRLALGSFPNLLRQLFNIVYALKDRHTKDRVGVRAIDIVLELDRKGVEALHVHAQL